MSRFLTYRPIPLAFALLFSLFNVGVPVVIAACPMTETGRPGLCFACFGDEETGSIVLTNVKDTSCCATVVVAERNTTAFVQSKKSISDESLGTVILTASLFPAFPPDLVEGAPASARLSPSPPLSDDIPIRVSALLI